jgi:hypothetical protein
MTERPGPNGTARAQNDQRTDESGACNGQGSREETTVGGSKLDEAHILGRAALKTNERGVDSRAGIEPHASGDLK